MHVLEKSDLMPLYDYPLNLRFKLIALAPRMIVTDNHPDEVLFIKQKVFKLKEDIRVFSDESESRELFNIQAEQILDFNTRYNFFDSKNGHHLGSVKARGWRSIWSATYLIDDPAGNQMMYVKEDNPWVKIADSIINDIPVIGWLSGFVFHPSYTCYRGADLDERSQPVMRIKKQGAFFENMFSIDLLDREIDPDEETSAILSFMLMVQFMRRRG